MVTITFQPGGKTVAAESGTPLVDAAKRAGVSA